MSDIERLLGDAFADAREQLDASPDLFERVHRTIDGAAARRRYRWRVASVVLAIAATIAAIGLVLSFDHGRLHMRWWVLELATNLALVALAVGLGPFIKRFGRSYAADVFRANPRTGKSYLVLTDIAYYLIFASFVLFTVTFERPAGWEHSVGAQLKGEVVRVGGILLIMGVLHAVNVVALPVIGRLLSSNKRFDDHDQRGGGRGDGRDTAGGVAPLGPGTWLLRIEAADDVTRDR